MSNSNALELKGILGALQLRHRIRPQDRMLNTRVAFSTLPQVRRSMIKSLRARLREYQQDANMSLEHPDKQ